MAVAVRVTKRFLNTMSFADLGLMPELLRAVVRKRLRHPHSHSIQAIPAVLAGPRRARGRPDGTGKTAAFVLPILQKLVRTTAREPRALVLTPTRELAAQVADSVRTYGKHAGIRTSSCSAASASTHRSIRLRHGCDVLVATPGRLIDLAEQNAVDLRHVQCFVLDEADRMLDMGFIRPIKRIIKMLPPSGRT